MPTRTTGGAAGHPDRSTAAPLEHQARTALLESARTLSLLEKQNASAVAAAAELILACFENGGTVFFCGNGGSAADAQHLAAEFSGRYLVDRPGLPAVALTTNSSAVTAIGNDYGYDQVFSRQLEGLAARGDVLVAITTSGGSESVRRAVATAHDMGLTVVGMTGAKGAGFAATCDVALITPSESTPNIQEGHIAMGHAFCLLVERTLFPGGDVARAPGTGGDERGTSSPYDDPEALRLRDDARTPDPDQPQATNVPNQPRTKRYPSQLKEKRHQSKPKAKGVPEKPKAKAVQKRGAPKPARKVARRGRV